MADMNQLLMLNGPQSMMGGLGGGGQSPLDGVLHGGIHVLGLKDINVGILGDRQGFTGKMIMQGGLLGHGQRQQGFFAKMVQQMQADFKQASQGVHIEHLAIQDMPIDSQMHLQAPSIGEPSGGMGGGMNMG